MIGAGALASSPMDLMGARPTRPGLKFPTPGDAGRTGGEHMLCPSVMFSVKESFTGVSLQRGVCGKNI